MCMSEVGAALQVYHALGELPSAVADVAARYKRRLDDELRTKLGDSAPAAIGPTRSVTSKDWAAGLWAALTQCLETWHAAVVAVWHLQRVLEKKRESGGRRTFASLLDDPSADSSSPLPPLLKNMWEGSLSLWK